MGNLDPEKVQHAFERSSWGNTRETATDWLAVLRGTDEEARRHLDMED